jgi:hypothetical protein
MESHWFNGAHTPAVDVTPLRNLPWSLVPGMESFRISDPPR